MREPKNQMLGTKEPPLMQLSVKTDSLNDYINSTANKEIIIVIFKKIENKEI